MNLEHEQVSELLAAYVREELDPEQHEAVRTHLDGCDACRAESSGLQALASLPPAELEPHERVTLRDGVRAAVRPRSWTARLAPALGALGLVAIAVVGGATLLGDGGSADRPQLSGPAQESAQDGTTADRLAPAARAKDAVDEFGYDSGAAGGGSENAGTEAGAPAPKNAAVAGQAEALEFAAEPTTFHNAAPLGPDLLVDRDTAFQPARTGRRLRSFFAVAPTNSWARQIESCNDVVSTFLPEDAHPAFAAVYQADRLLVMGFIWSFGEQQRYAFWGWPQGDCSVVTPIHASGTI